LLHTKLHKLCLAVGLSGILALSGCHKKTVPPPPPPPPPAPQPSPTASITANPDVIQQGQSSTLTWSTTNANSATITGIGSAPTSGTQSVSPTQSTTYTITVNGPGGTAQESARVTVNVPAPPAAPATPSLSEEELFEQNVHDVYFDYDKYALRSQDQATADSDATFLKAHPGMKIVIGGHCDDRGSEEYNLALGENRAEALKQALVTDGVPASRIRTVSYGKEKPFCTEENDACWQKNRVDHLKLDQ
jgi:peptidoglycan-associated lipoprotein